MNINEVNPRYLQSLLDSRSGPALQHMKNCLNGRVTLRNFGEQDLDFRSFDWHTGPSDRNWWWQVQQLPFLRWFSQSRQLWVDTALEEVFFEFCIDSLNNWLESTRELDDQSPLCWHDHATALRLRLLLDFRVLLIDRQFSCPEKPPTNLESLLFLHVDWLSMEDNYTKGTNHGLEQAEALYRSGLIFPKNERFAAAGDLGFERLQLEIVGAFTQQGVHKENSPGYQKFMMGKIQGLINLLGMDVARSVDGLELIHQRAERFLKAITLPDGYLPTIGDTGRFEIGIKEKVEPDYVQATRSGEVGVHDYGASGYVVIDYDDQVTGAAAKLIVKSGHESHYHRHDDDLSIFWQIGERCLLGDAGLLSHNEKSFERQFVRSVHGHTSFSVVGVPAERRVANLPRPPELEVVTNPMRVIARTWCFKGYSVRRVINVESLCIGRLLIEDRARGAAVATANGMSSWLVPEARLCVMEDDYRSVRLGIAGNLELTFKFVATDAEIDSVAVVSGVGSDQTSTGIVAKRFGVSVPSFRLIRRWNLVQSARTLINLKVASCLSAVQYSEVGERECEG